MLQNYLKIALRNLKRRKAYAFINIAGLAIGMACSILIFLSVRHDLSFDRFHTKADRIFRVLTIDRAFGVTAQHVGITLPALGPAMDQDLPEVERAVRMQNGGRSLLSYEDKNLYAENLLYAENTLFDIFDFPLLTGN
ncbi:MAG TPA: ABC transporter permease, partial [Rhodothermales bacterium]|nr:ABC transporter permease [Rhodothermales bacterium]